MNGTHTLDQIVAFWNQPEELVEVRVALVACHRKARHGDIAVVQLRQQLVVLRVVLNLVIVALRGRNVIRIVVRSKCRHRVVARVCPCRGQVDGRLRLGRAVACERRRALDRDSLAARRRTGHGRTARSAARGVGCGGRRGGLCNGVGGRERHGALLLWGGCARGRAAPPQTPLARAGGRRYADCVRVAHAGGREEVRFGCCGARVVHGDGVRAGLRGRGRRGGLVLVRACDRLCRRGGDNSGPVRLGMGVFNMGGFGSDGGHGRGRYRRFDAGMGTGTGG